MDNDIFKIGVDLIEDHTKDYDLIIFGSYNFVARIKKPVIHLYSSMLVSLEDQDNRNMVTIQNRIDSCKKFGGYYQSNY